MVSNKLIEFKQQIGRCKMYQTGVYQKIRYFWVRLIIIAIASAFFVSPQYGINSAYAGLQETPDEDITKVGDFFQWFLPAAAFGSTFFVRGPDGKMWDKEGTWQSLKSIGSTVITTQALKEITEKIRPRSFTGSTVSAISFPSGHTSAAFSGAAFINTRYGPWWGVPSYAAALFTAYSRVQASAHFLDDFTAGAAIGLMYNWLWVTPQSWSGKFAIAPIALDEGTGLQVTMAMGDDAKKDADAQKIKPKDPRFRFNFGFGPAYLEKNEITSPTSGGTTFDLYDFDRINDPTTTAGIEFDIFLNKHNELSFFWLPLETRDTGQFSNDVFFAGQTFPANTDMVSAWQQNEIRARYRYNIIPESNWQIKLGAGLMVQYTEIELATANFSQLAGVDDWVALPILNGSIGYKITPWLTFSVDAEGIYLSDDAMIDAIAAFNFKIGHSWDITLGYEYYARDIETSDLTNHVIYNVPYLAVAHSW